MSELGAPFNWCDRICERCPLSDECPIPERDRSVRGVPIVAVIRKIAVERAEAARAEILPAGAVPPPWPVTAPRPSDAARLVEASLRYAHSLRDLAARDREIMRLSILLHAKVARIA